MGVKEHLYFADRLRYDYDTLTHHHLIRLSIISIMYKSSDERVDICIWFSDQLTIYIDILDDCYNFSRRFKV